MQPLNTIARPSSLVDHRLGTGVGQVDDLQPAVGQRDRAVLDQSPSPSGPREASAGAIRRPRQRRPVAVEPELAAESAHAPDPRVSARIVVVHTVQAAVPLPRHPHGPGRPHRRRARRSGSRRQRAARCPSAPPPRDELTIMLPAGRHPGQRGRRHLDPLADEHERAQVDVARRQPVAVEDRVGGQVRPPPARSSGAGRRGSAGGPRRSPRRPRAARSRPRRRRTRRPACRPAGRAGRSTSSRCSGIAAQVRRHVREQRLLAQVVLDQPGHVRVHRLVVADPVAERVGQRHRAGVHRGQQRRARAAGRPRPAACSRPSSSIRRYSTSTRYRRPSPVQVARRRRRRAGRCCAPAVRPSPRRASGARTRRSRPAPR